MKNAVIYDVPGFDSPTQMHEDQTIEKMRLADAIVLIVSAYKPSFTGPLVDIFRKESDYDGIRFGDKMFVFANMADMANTLDDNMDIIRKDLLEHSIMENKNFDRIVPGSARAKLEEEGKLNGSVALEALKKKGISSGIDEMKEKLEQYNRTERFAILKARINRIQTEIYNIFRKMSEKQKITQSPNMLPETYGKENIALLMEAQNAIREELRKYRAKLREEFTPELSPLTEKMKSEVISNITVECFGVSEEEIVKAENKNVLTTNMNQSEDVERIIRKEKYMDIYNAFSDGIVNLAVEEHSRCDREIVKIFLDGLGVNANSSYYNQIEEKVNKYIQKQKETIDDKGYYKSLVQRFSVDLFEILLELSFGSMDRWRKFSEERTDFYSLTMFDKNSDLTVSPDKQPLLYSILFHDKQQNTVCKCVSEIADFLKSSLEVVVDSKILSLIKVIVKIKKADALQYIEDMFKNMDRSKDANAKYNIVFNSLESKVDCFKQDGINLDEVKLDKESYEKYFYGKRDKNSEEIKAEINEDIEILQKALEDVVLNAICMEKTFKALEFQTIENLIKSLEDIEFGELVYNNIYFIKPEVFSKIDEENNKQMVYANVMREINNIIIEMKQVTKEEEA